jgi:hypothetical protein
VRMMPARAYPAVKPAQVKRSAASVKHISAPLKGLSLSSKLVPGDPLTATVLDNFVIEENRIKCRPGTRLAFSLPDLLPVETFVPYYGQPNRLAAANAGKLTLLDGTMLEDGFSSNDWSWTSFSNLSATDYTVMVNGVDGVWSWDGGAVAGSVIEETVTAPVGEPWIVPDQFSIVLSHMNRLWFADNNNLAIYYLPLQQKTGEVQPLPLNAVFKRGGTIRAMYSWTTDGAINLSDQLVIFTSNGECAIFGGVDPGPSGDFFMNGLFRFDAPMSKHSVINYGGELYVLISTGLVPMSTLMRAESENLGQSDKNVVSEFFDTSLKYRARPGWSVFINPMSGRIYCNMPLGSVNNYRQMVRFMPNPVWGSWSNVPSRSWGWVDNRVFFGTDLGKIYEMHPDFLNDDGEPIRVDVQAAWSNYGTPAIKHFKMVLPYLQSDGTPRPFVDVKVDYDMTPPNNQPDVTFADAGAEWDLAPWDTSSWGGDASTHNNWSGVGVIGHVGAPRLVALISNAEFALNGWDVLFETGSIFG